jgi:hypothetical protein
MEPVLVLDGAAGAVRECALERAEAGLVNKCAVVRKAAILKDKAGVVKIAAEAAACEGAVIDERAVNRQD